MNTYMILNYPLPNYMAVVRIRITNEYFYFSIYADDYWEALRKAQYALSKTKNVSIVRIERKFINEV